MSDDIEWTIDSEGWLRPPRKADAMSDDIVKRLRGIWRDPASIPRIELDAADEIERLREENRKLRDAARKMTQGDLMQ